MLALEFALSHDDSGSNIVTSILFNPSPIGHGGQCLTSSLHAPLSIGEVISSHNTATLILQSIASQKAASLVYDRGNLGITCKSR